METTNEVLVVPVQWGWGGGEDRNDLSEATETRDKNWRDKPHSLVSGLTVNIKVSISQRNITLFL